MGAHHSPHKRTRISVSHELGKSHAYIAATEGVTILSIPGIVKRYRVQTSGRSAPRSGRSPLLTERDIRLVLRAIAVDPFIKNPELLVEAGLTCSVDTLTRALRARGIQHFRALQRPKLTPVHARKRLAFARLYVERPAGYWKQWIFSDETTVDRGDGVRQKWAFCRRVRQLYLSSQHHH